ncbi:hypothetical protein Q3G72_010386 [Acer saccharum]|nr:hypothetical protein Q3G72_010386 [Acer saccharum]
MVSTSDGSTRGSEGLRENLILPRNSDKEDSGGSVGKQNHENPSDKLILIGLENTENVASVAMTSTMEGIEAYLGGEANDVAQQKADGEVNKQAVVRKSGRKWKRMARDSMSSEKPSPSKNYDSLNSKRSLSFKVEDNEKQACSRFPSSEPGSYSISFEVAFSLDEKRKGESIPEEDNRNLKKKKEMTVDTDICLSTEPEAQAHRKP